MLPLLLQIHLYISTQEEVDTPLEVTGGIRGDYFQFYDDLDTYMDRVAEDVIVFTVGDFDRLRLDTNGVSVKGDGLRVGSSYWTTAPPNNGLIVEGDVGIGTTTPAYTLDVNGTIRATKSLTTGINVETLSGDKTLTPGIDAMYQYLDEGDAFRTITLATTTAKAGDRFIIRHNGAYYDHHYLKVKQGAATLDYIYAGTTREFIFNGTNWTWAETGPNNVAIGYSAQGYSEGIGIGVNAYGYGQGVAVGHGAKGYSYGVAVGHSARGMRYGAALGYRAGYNIDTTEDRYNTLVGAYSGYRITTGKGNVILGYKSGYDSTYSPTTGSYNILIGYQSWTPATTTSNFLNIGGLIFGTNLATTTNTISSGNIGIGTTTPGAKLDVNGNIIADDVILNDWQLSSPTYTSIHDWLNTTQSAGKLTGGEITDNGDGTISVSAGTGFIKTTDSDVGTTKFFDWSANNSVSLTDNDTNYIYVEYNSGSPQIVSSTSTPSDKNTNILLGLVYRDGTDLYITTAGQVVSNYAKKTLWKDLEVNGKFQRVNGIIISETGTRNIAITAGSVYAGLTKEAFPAFDSSGTDTFTYYYRDGAGGWTKVTGQSQIDNLHYDDGSGTLAELSNSSGWRHYYGVHWVYADPSGHVFVVYGQGNYSLSEAENAQPPSSLPDIISDIGGLVGKIIIEKGSDTFERVESAFDTFFIPHTVVNHNELSGLQGGAADEYYHLNANDYNARWQSDGTYVYNTFGNIGN